MELNQVIDFIKTASPDDIAVIKGEVKHRGGKVRPDVLQMCTDDVGRLLKALPHVTTKYKGYRYDMTAVCYVRHIKELVNMILQNYQVKPDERGYPVWTHANTIPEVRASEYQDVFRALTDTVLRLMEEHHAVYNQEDSI